MSAAVRAVVFDLDGTLLDSMTLVLRVYGEVLAPYRPGLTDESLLAMLGGPPDRLFEKLIGDPVRTKAALARLDALAGEKWPSIEAFPRMAETIDFLAERCAGGLWTGRERASTEQLLRRHGLSGRVQACVCGDDLASHKPDPEGLREVLRQLGVGADEAIFVGDADVDVRAGAAAGVRTILIHQGRTVAAEVRERAWRIVGTATEAYTLLRQGFPGLVYKK